MVSYETPSLKLKFGSAISFSSYALRDGDRHRALPSLDELFQALPSSQKLADDVSIGYKGVYWFK
jgi:hypothetical protein